MPAFTYEARDQDGQLTAGTITAESLEQAGQLLSRRDLFVIRVATDPARGRVATARGRASRLQIAWAFTQLAVMVETGLRLTDALDCLARQACHPRLKALLEQVSRTVHEGRPLSEAMEMFPNSFSPSLIALIRSSEMSGTMGRVLRRSAGYLMNDIHVLRRVRAALMYPLFMFAMCLTVTVFLLAVVLPRFADIFTGRGAVLPGPTRILMTVSESFLADWHIWLAAAGAFLMVSFIWSRTPLARRQRDWMLISLPILSRVFPPLYQYRTFRSMAVLLETGVHLVDAVRIIQDVVPNSYYRNLWRQVEKRMECGERLAEPFLASDLVPEAVAQMIDSGDRSGKLGYVFAQLADFTEEEYNQAVKSVTQFIEPAMILFMGGMIGFVAASLMLPLFQAGRVVAG